MGYLAARPGRCSSEVVRPKTPRGDGKHGISGCPPGEMATEAGIEVNPQDVVYNHNR